MEKNIEVERIAGDDSLSTDLLRTTEEEKNEKVKTLLNSRKEEIDDKMNEIAEIVLRCNNIVEACVLDKLSNTCNEEKYKNYKLSYLTESIKAIGLRNNDLIGFDMDEYVLTNSAKFDAFVVHSLNELKKLTLEAVKNEKAKKEENKGRGE